MTYKRTHVALVMLATGALVQTLAAQPVSLIESNRSRCVIVYPDNCALSAKTATRISEYLQQQTDVQVAAHAASAFRKPHPDMTIIVLDGTANHGLASSFTEVDTKIASDRLDAYRLQVLRREGSSPFVLALGKSPQGAKFAAYRFMRELEIEGLNARIRRLDVAAQPFIKTRSVALFNVWGMPIELTRRHNTESWSPSDLERYIDMYDFYGFNAIESHDRFNDNYLEPLFGIKRAQWREKVHHMSDIARANGQEFFLRIWGHSVMETPKLARTLGPNEAVPKKLKHLCPNDPTERKEWESEIRDYYVTNYAGRIDNLIGHWCDPGVCRRNGCTFETPLKLQMELHEAFKQHDPKFNSTFSLWFFDVTSSNPAGWARGGWPGYRDDRGIIEAGILSKEVMIATATAGIPAAPARGKYKDDIVQAIVAAGHKPALWTWYRADHEIRPSLHIHMHQLLGNYFKSLPASAKDLEWHNVERNVHGAANTANYYVAGRLMWEPELEVDDLLREFLTLAFGPENAPRIIPAYAAIEQIRCHACERNWESARLTGTGTADPRRDAQIARKALAHLAEVRLDHAYRPRIPLDISLDRLIADLKASLEVIRDFADCRASELPAFNMAVEAKDHKRAAALLDELRSKYSKWSLTLAGRQEWSLLDRQMRALGKN